MKSECVKQSDTLTITLRQARIKERDEVWPGAIANLGDDGEFAGCEILDASRRNEKPVTLRIRNRGTRCGRSRKA